MKEEILKQIESLEAILTVVSDNDLLDTDDVENFYRNQDRIINGSLIDKAWEALKLKGKVKEVHNNALKMVVEVSPTDIHYANKTTVHDTEIENERFDQGWNASREKFINNIQKLKI